MRTKEKLLLPLLAIGLLSRVLALGIFGVFSATTQNTGNEIVSGTVSFTNNSAGQAMYNITGAKPGQTLTRCIKATYTGSLAATVKLYTDSTAGPLASYLNVTVTQGTDASTSFPNCGSFVADTNGQLYSGTLQSFEQTYTSYSNGLSTGPGAPANNWTTGSAVVYQFVITLQSGAPDSAQGTSTGVHDFIWEAHDA